MRVYRLLFFLTLVLSSLQVFAAPTSKTTLETKPFKGETDPFLKGVDTSLYERPATFKLNISLGFEGGNYLERDQYLQSPFISLRYMPLEDEIPDWDYQIEVNAENLVGLAAGRRWYCCPDDEYIPYLRASAHLFLKGSEGLGGLAEIRRWRARASAGVGRKFSFEMGFGIAITGTDLFSQFGYNFEF